MQWRAIWATDGLLRKRLRVLFRYLNAIAMGGLTVTQPCGPSVGRKC